MDTRRVELQAFVLDDLCNVAELAANYREDEQGHADSLVTNLRGSVREVRARADLQSVPVRHLNPVD